MKPPIEFRPRSTVDPIVFEPRRTSNVEIISVAQAKTRYPIAAEDILFRKRFLKAAQMRRYRLKQKGLKDVAVPKESYPKES